MAIAPIGAASAQLVRFDQALPNIQATAETELNQTKGTLPPAFRFLSPQGMQEFRHRGPCGFGGPAM